MKGEPEGKDDSARIACGPRRHLMPLCPVLMPLSLALLTFLAAACTRATPDQDTRPLLPGGYLVHVDTARSDPGHFGLDQDKQGIHIMTGPGGIAWRPADSIHAGDFRVEATLTVLDAPIGYREGYGIFVGGHDLEGATQTYTYLLVRPDGKFLVKRRRGASTEILMDWTDHEAVRRVDRDGDAPVNTLAVEASDGEARFLVNGSVVHRAPLAEVRPLGIAGLRINHRLDVRLLSWSLGPLAPQPADSTGA